jgi:hypothetical protein
MARYDWPGSPPRTSEDKVALRDEWGRRYWCRIADGLLEEAGDALRDRLASLAEAGITEAQIDRQRWLPIGPSAILRGQATGSPRVAGRVRDIRRSPDGARIYAASANGGVWFSGDGGQSWSPLGGMATTPDRNARGRSANTLVVGCLHVEFGANADADTVYVGTGEPTHDYAASGIPGSNNGGIGILKLTRPVSAALADPTGNPWEREAPNLTGAGIYRIVRDPANADTLVAATTLGLFTRSGPFTRNADWTRVAAAPFNVQNEDRIFTTDAVWVPAATAPSAAPARLFVALVNLGRTSTDSAIYVSEAGVAGPFAKLNLPNYQPYNRIALAAALPTAAAPSTHPQVVYVLSSAGKGNPRLWRIDGKAVHVVRNLPPPLFGGTRTVGGKSTETNDQSWYDMAIAVDPSNVQRVFFGGSAEIGTVGWNASLYRCTVSGTAAADDFSLDFAPANNLTPWTDPTFIGDGVHADIHCIRVSDDGINVWIGCDGGVFASSSRGAPGSFSARNTGLAITECGFVASHPAHPGPVATGTQDNGVIRRIGDTIWQRQPWGGDGGGVQYHPQPGRPAFLIGQYTNVGWYGNGHFDPPIARAALSATKYAAEAQRSLFYSGAAAVPGATPGKARLALGSYRLWLTDDWDPLAPAAPLMSWRTLPSSRDPLAGAKLDFDRDEIDRSAGKVVSVRWLDRGTVNGTAFQNSKLLVLYERAIARVFQVDGADRWDRQILAWTKKKRITQNSDIPASGAPSEKLPMLGAWSEIAVHRATKTGDPAFKGSFYVSTTGASEMTGTGINEFDRMDTLWWFDGKAKFYPAGLRNHAHGTKAPAFSVLCDPENPDIVYVGTAMGVWKGTIDHTGATPTWNWEMFSIGLPEAFVQDLSIFWNPAAPNGGLKLLRAAIQSRGVWEVDISANPASVGKTFLRVHELDTRQVLPTSLTNLTDETAAPAPYPRCLSPDIVVVNPVPAAWAGGPPTEAEVAALSPWVVSIGPAANRISAQRVTATTHSAFVLVHHRHTKPVPATEIKVALLKRRMVEADGDGGELALSDAWKTAVVDLVANGQNVNLDDHWKRVDAPEDSDPVTSAVTPANTVKSPAGAIEARLPRAAAFSLNLAAATAGQRYLLLAIVSSSADPLTTAEMVGAKVGDVVLNCRHVCARVVSL